MAGEALTEREKDIHARLSQAFVLMNEYAKDPFNMGGDPRNLSRIEPQSILAEVYLILAPAQVALQNAARGDSK